jgi:spore maturation protein A
MLNYIWAGLIIISLVFASVQDTHDLVVNKYHNGESQEVSVQFPRNFSPDKQQTVLFKTSGMDSMVTAKWHQTDKGTELIVPVSKSLPDHWQTVANLYDSNSHNHLRAKVLNGGSLQSGTYKVMLPSVKFVKLRAITKAAFNMADFAVKLAIGLIGVMAFWLGLMRIADKSGLMYKLVKVVNPFLRFLFPNVPKDHPAFGAISLNLAANILGLGNAATPLGIKAMEELQKLNPEKDTATNAMCMFLTINTASVQLVPPVTLVALMGIRIGHLLIGIILATATSLIIGIMAAKLYSYRYPDEPIPETES